VPGTDPASTPADVVKEDNHEPLKEALALWQDQEPREEHQDPGKKEHLQFWDSDEIETLDTYKGRVRVIRAVVTKPDKSLLQLFVIGGWVAAADPWIPPTP
jgi:hypothetical protein